MCTQLLRVSLPYTRKGLTQKKSTNQYKSTPNFKCNYFVHQVIIVETSKVTNQEYRKRYLSNSCKT